eukprot:c4281_g1_i1.p1 GENE.c4281_g1_i1~~c4281_g1_i1.p1  ORF type:complete len:204 (-),score=42.53 c4281_g1_i1:14-625(-)
MRMKLVLAVLAVIQSGAHAQNLLVAEAQLAAVVPKRSNAGAGGKNDVTQMSGPSLLVEHTPRSRGIASQNDTPDTTHPPIETTPHSDHHARASLFSNFPAFDAQRPLLCRWSKEGGALGGVSVSFEVVVNVWADKKRLAGEEHCVEIFTTTEPKSGDTQVNLWVRGSGVVASVPLTVGQVHKITATVDHVSMGETKQPNNHCL